jgi:hypothetical protein
MCNSSSEWNTLEPYIKRSSTVYIAAVWNTYRKTHLMLVDILLRCAQQLSRPDLIPGLEQQAHTLTTGIIASVPYYLSCDLHDYLQSIRSGIAKIPVGRPIGGLLLLHPLYVGAQCSAVPLPLQDHLNRCLAWIGHHRGIGQATLLSKVGSLCGFFIGERDRAFGPAS